MSKMTLYLATDMTFRDWIDREYVRWSADQPRGERSQDHFAKWLGISRNTLLNYLNKNTLPEGENLKKIARKLSFEVYKVLGIDPPDPRLDRIEELWPLLSEASKKRIAEQINEYAAKRQ